MTDQHLLSRFGRFQNVARYRFHTVFYYSLVQKAQTHRTTTSRAGLRIVGGYNFVFFHSLEHSDR
jgi:hypothetical protein